MVQRQKSPARKASPARARKQVAQTTGGGGGGGNAQNSQPAPAPITKAKIRIVVISLLIVFVGYLPDDVSELSLLGAQIKVEGFRLLCLTLLAYLLWRILLEMSRSLSQRGLRENLNVHFSMASDKLVEIKSEDPIKASLKAMTPVQHSVWHTIGNLSGALNIAAVFVVVVAGFVTAFQVTDHLQDLPQAAFSHLFLLALFSIFAAGAVLHAIQLVTSLPISLLETRLSHRKKEREKAQKAAAKAQKEKAAAEQKALAVAAKEKADLISKISNLHERFPLEHSLLGSIALEDGQEVAATHREDLQQAKEAFKALQHASVPLAGSPETDKAMSALDDELTFWSGLTLSDDDFKDQILAICEARQTLWETRLGDRLDTPNMLGPKGLLTRWAAENRTKILANAPE